MPKKRRNSSTTELGNRKRRAKARWRELLINLEDWIEPSGKLKRATLTNTRTIYKVEVTGKSGGYWFTVILHANMNRNTMTVEIRCKNDSVREEIADGLEALWTVVQDTKERGDALILQYDRIPFNNS